MPHPRLTLQTVNALDRDAFTAALGGLFEGSPWVAAETWPARPFASPDHILAALQATVDRSSEERKLALIRAHPDLVGRAARAGPLGPASTREQAAAGLDRLTPEEVAAFDRLNRAYRERFGFPFVVCARENQKAGILAGFAARLPNPREREVAVALAEVAKIARLRLLDLLGPEESAR